MLTDQRQTRIRAELSREGAVQARDLAARLGVSEDTIRRDLNDLASAGACTRVYGGAIAPVDAPLAARTAQSTAEKSALARLAVALIRPHQTLFIDAGSTNLAIARALPMGTPLTVATNALSIASVLAEREGCRLILLGGVFSAQTGACTGTDTLHGVAGISADLFFLGTCGLDPERGATGFDPAEAEVKRAMVAASARVAVAATTQKLGTHAPFRIAPTEAIGDLITLPDAPASLLARFASAGTRLYP